MPYSTQTTNPQNHIESINVRIRGELYFFSTHTWCSTIQWKYCNTLKNRPRISWEYAECSTNWAQINRNPRWFVMIREICPHDSYKKVHPCFGGISSKMNDPRMSAVIFVNSWDSDLVWNRGIKQYFLHILSLETDKNPYWISGSWRMNVYPFSWPISR